MARSTRQTDDENKVGKYTLLNRLTMGGMAELFLGYTTGPGGFRKYVVIKRILPDAASNEQFVEMFLDEARITAGFSHSNIVQVYDLGEDREGLYVVMEFVAGQNLNQIVNACAEQQAVFPLGFSLSVLHECALALHYAHTYRKPTGEAYPVIHRDVAQKNIMVTYDGQVRLLDFGIAKAKGALSRTSAGTVKGTAGYMSPEQVRGEPLDGRSDVFALGVVLWESCTGKRLFSAQQETEEMRMILDAPIQPPASIEASVPEAVSEVVMRALARPRDDRYASAKDLARALHAAAEPLLFDPEERAAFMHERFSHRIQATQRLFDVSDAAANSPQFQEVVKSFQEKVEYDAPSVRVAAGVRSGNTARQKAMSEADQQLAQLQLEAERLVGPKEVRSTNYALLLVAALGALIILGLGIKACTAPSDVDPETGLTRYPGESTEPAPRGLRPIELPPTPVPPPEPVNVPETVQAKPPPEPVKPPDTVVVDTPTTPIVLPENKKPLPPAVPVTPVTSKKPKPGSTGTVTIALFPSGGTIRRGAALLCRGTLCKMTLPQGPQQLTVIGADDVPRVLPVQVGPTPAYLRITVTDLPPQR